MNINDIYGGNYVKASDLQGREHTVLIESFRLGEFQAKSRDGRDYMKKKVVLKFKDKEKQLVCNLTNAGAIAFLYGPDPADWVGRSVVIYPTQTQFGAGMTDCIRIKPPNAGGQIGVEQLRRIAATDPNGGHAQTPLRPPGTAQDRQFVSQDHGNFKSSTTQAIQQQNDDPLSEEIPF